MFRNAVITLALTIAITGSTQRVCAEDAKKETGRLVMFIGMDISGSFMKTSYYDDALDFISHYIYAHLNGYGGLEVPHTLFVGSIGGDKPNEPKTFFPIQAFENKNVAEIHQKLKEIFTKDRQNTITDFNAFFKQVATYTTNKNLVMRPISVVLLSDGIPDVPKKNGKHDYRSFDLSPLENLTRNLTLRLLYTSAEVGMNWQSKVKRQRIKIWTQDAKVMTDWKDSHIFVPGTPFEKQDKFFAWIKDNVDFNVRLKRVD